MSADTPTALCFDVGGTKIAAAFVSPEGTLIASCRRMYQTGRSAAGLVDHMADMAAELSASIAGKGHRVAGVGCAFAGILNDKTGVVFQATNLWPEIDIPLGEMMAERFGCPATVQMDASMAALGEYWKGGGAGSRNFAYVVVGTGIGAGLVLNGELFLGERGTAGEFGHTRIVQGGPLCGCGRQGCLEALARGPAIAAAGGRAARDPSATILKAIAHTREIQTADVFSAARQGDVAALGVIEQEGTYLGQGVANLLHLLDLDVVVFGGGVMEGGGDLMLPVIRRVAESEAGPWINWQAVSIKIAALPATAPLLGVAKILWSKIISS